MKRARAWIHTAALCAFAGATGVACQTHVLEFRPADSPAASATEETIQGSVVFGLFETSDPAVVPCPRRLNRIEITRNWLDLTIHFFAGGIYTQRRVRFYCNANDPPTWLTPRERYRRPAP